MRSSLVVLAISIMLLGCAYASKLTLSSPVKQAAFKPMGDDCDVCIGFMQTDIQLIVNAIIEVGIEDGCSEVCNYYLQGLEADVCSLYCEVKGINAFSAILQELNPDPIAACMALDVCPTNQYSKGRITFFKVGPASGPQGTTFTAKMIYQITNTTGTGQLLIQVNPPGGQNANPFGAAQTIQAMKPGGYEIDMQIQTQPNQDQPFNAGLYQVVGAICEGTCGATNRYAYTIAEASTRFSITTN